MLTAAAAVAVFAALVPAAPGAAAKQAEARTPLLILFGHTFTSGNVDIVSVFPDGTGMVRLTTRPAFDACPAGAPNGARISFCNDATGTLVVRTMSRFGGVSHRTTHFDGWAADPDFRTARSTHKRIAFTADVGNGHDIYSSNLRGRNLLQLTDDPAADDYPAWSPNSPGERIAFVSDRSGTPQVYVMMPTGRRVKQLTHDPNGVTDGPDWSPDGSQIVFAAGPPGAEDIFVMNANGSHVTPLTTDPASDVSPAWSPDGTQIAFLSTRVPGSRNVFVMNADGTDQHAITKPGSIDYAPAWLPGRGRPGSL